MQHKITTHKGDTLLLIEVPSDEQRRKIGTFCNDEEVRFEICYLGLNGVGSRKPFLNFHVHKGCVIYNVPLDIECELIGTTSTLTDEQIKPFCKEENVWDGMFKEYFLDELESNAIDLSKEWAVLKLKND